MIPMTTTTTTTALRRAIYISNTARCYAPSGSSIISVVSSWSLSSNTTTMTDGRALHHHHRSFHTPPARVKGDEDDDQNNVNTKILVMPPNLKIDPRSVSSPFYGLEKVKDVHKKSFEEGEEEDDGDSENQKDGVAHEIEYDEDDAYEEEDESGTAYDLTNALEPIYAIPLPERLHVPIFQFIPTSSTTESSSSSSSSEEIGTIHVSPDIFGQDPIRTDLLHRCVVYQRNKKRGRRNNGARTKTISEVSGSGRKVRPQKGTGSARAGHSRPPHWRGGAKAHGPKGSVQNYETKLNKKVRRAAIKMALSQKLKEGNLILVDGFGGLDTYKTKDLAIALEKLGDIGGRHGCTAYLVDHAEDDEDPDKEEEEQIITSVGGVHVNLTVASRNLFKIKVTNQKWLNVYDILKHDKLVMSLSAFQAIENRYSDHH